ncbi:MAG: hypothetical protein WA863_09745, partial [Methyloceanibacter sp.]
QIWRSGDVAGYAESFLLGKHLGHVGVIPVLACRGREIWRSNFLVPLLLRLRGLVPFRKLRVRRPLAWSHKGGRSLSTDLSSRAELATL